MEKRYIAALDQGTTSSRCILFDREQKIVGVAQKEFTQFYPRPGWVEHDPMEIWSSQYGVLMEALAQSGVNIRELAGIGITNQRETAIVWDRETGRPVYHAIVWQCRRTAGLCEELKADPDFVDYVKEHTGLLVDAYFSATKLKWILDNVPGVREQAMAGKLLFGTVDSWLIWRLTGGTVHVTDYTNASRTMLYNIKDLQWDEGICRRLEIPMGMLPQVRSSSEVYGYVNIQGVEVPIAGIAGDQQAALFGQTCFEPGEAKNTYGTGCFLLMNTGETPFVSKNGLLTTIAIGLADKVQYALEGSIFMGGAVVQWLRDELRLLRDAPQSERYCTAVEDAHGVYVVPAFAGLGAPYWEPYARGTILGLTRGVSKEHFVRAVVESLAYQTNDLLLAMKEESGLPITSLKVDGGASANNFLMQFQADLSNIRLERPQCIETTALGAAYLAGLSAGYWKDLDEIRANWGRERQFLPSISEAKRDALIKGWNRAVRCALAWARED